MKSRPSTPTIRDNPWLWGLPGTAGLLVVIAIMVSSGARADAGGVAFGMALFQLAGTIFTGWLVACAVCWHIAWAARRQ